MVRRKKEQQNLFPGVHEILMAIYESKTIEMGIASLDTDAREVLPLIHFEEGPTLESIMKYKELHCSNKVFSLFNVYSIRKIILIIYIINLKFHIMR